MEFEIPDPIVDIPAPRFKMAPVEAFSKDEIESMIKACSYTREADTMFRRSCTFRRPTARRDHASILTLLETGLRASELCSLRIENIKLKTGRVEVVHGFQGGAKGGKGRRLFLVQLPGVKAIEEVTKNKSRRQVSLPPTLL